MFRISAYYIVPLLALLFTSCQSILPSLPHNTPHFTQKNQAEILGTIDVLRGAVNVAYSPIKYVALQGNAYGYKYFGQKYYTRYAEGAIGFYKPLRRMSFAVYGGYGMGSAVWQENTIFGKSAVAGYVNTFYGFGAFNLKLANYQLRTAFVHAYVSLNPENESWLYYGPSFKYMHNRLSFSSLTTSSGNTQIDEQHRIMPNTEFAAFVKARVGANLYFFSDLGVSYSPPVFSYIAHVGMTLKF